MSAKHFQKACVWTRCHFLATPVGRIMVNEQSIPIIMLAFLRVTRLTTIYIMITVIIPLVCGIPACLPMLVGYRVDAWRFCARVWMRCVLCVRIRTYGSPLIDHGIILANHISMMDGVIDNWIHQSDGIYRGQYLLSMLLYGLLTHMQGWGIRIQ